MTRCAICREEFERQRMTQKTCGHAVCNSEHKRQAAISKALKAERREIKQRMDDLKTKPQLAKEAQTAFNAFIRARDADLPCVSCGRFHQGQWHAGHFYSTGARPELRFNEDNCHKQCQPCNTELHGNLLLYRESLLLRIGPVRFAELSNPHPAQHYTKEDLREIKAKYKAKLKELQK